MTTAEAIATDPDGAEEQLAPWELRDVCLRISMPVVLSDEQLERINHQNPGWKIELGPNSELEVRTIAGGNSSDISGELGRQVANWRVAGGGGRVRDPDGTYKVSHPNLGERTLAPDCSVAQPRTHRVTHSQGATKAGLLAGVSNIRDRSAVSLRFALRSTAANGTLAHIRRRARLVG